MDLPINAWQVKVLTDIGPWLTLDRLSKTVNAVY